MPTPQANLSFFRHSTWTTLGAVSAMTGVASREKSCDFSLEGQGFIEGWQASSYCWVT